MIPSEDSADSCAVVVLIAKKDYRGEKDSSKTGKREGATRYNPGDANCWNHTEWSNPLAIIMAKFGKYLQAVHRSLSSSFHCSWLRQHCLPSMDKDCKRNLQVFSTVVSLRG